MPANSEVLLGVKAVEDKKRTMLAVVIIAVVLWAVLYSFSLNLFAATPELVLADPNATASVDPGGEDPDERGGVAVEVSTHTVQSLVASLARYESYSRSMTIEYYSGGERAGTVTAQTWVDHGWIRASVTLSSGRVEHSIIGNGQLWLWYDQDNRVYTGPMGEMNADLIQRLPTYEDVLALDQDSITDAGYVEHDGLPCVYVEAVFPELNYVERYWISETSGLLMAAEAEKEGELIYSMISHEVISPLDQAVGAFSLPDGTELHAPVQ